MKMLTGMGIIASNLINNEMEGILFPSHFSFFSYFIQ